MATRVAGGTAWALDYEEGRQLLPGGDADTILFDRIDPHHMASLSHGNPLLIGSETLVRVLNPGICWAA